MNIKFPRTTHILVLAVLLFGLQVEYVEAQASAGVSITPSLIEERADPGSVLTQDVYVTNISDSERTYYVYIRDISGVHDQGNPVYLEEGDEKTGYELSSWVTLGLSEVTLAPGSDVRVPVTITVPADATPGSHFGAVFVSLEPPKFREIGAAVGFDVANIISIRISGDVTEHAQIRSFETDQYIYGKPTVEFTARVENKGNVLVRPVGPLEVYNMFGKRVETMEMNSSRGGVFPGTIRDFKLTWQENGLAFGRYEARVGLVYGDKEFGQQTITAVATYWVFPMVIVKPTLAALIVLFVAIYIGVRLYIRRKLDGRRLVRRHGRSGRSTVVLVLGVWLGVSALFLLVLLILFA